MSADFVVEAWGAWMDALPRELKQASGVGGGKSVLVPRWRAEVFDCDNIAVDFAVFLSRCMAVDSVVTGKARGNAAAGRFDFMLNADPAQGHCRNWFIDHDNKAHVFDAGNCQMDGQSTAENATVFSGESV